MDSDIGGMKVHPELFALAEIFTSVRLMGPPMSDQLLELVCHLFSPEEACIARHLPFYLPMPLDRIARRVRKRPEEIRPRLETMADRKVIFSTDKGYSLLPLIPGMFEYLLMDGRDSQWHRRYARLINALYATGYTREYSTTSSPLIRNIPVQTVIESTSRIVDTDLMSEMIEAHDKLAVMNVCQCRQSHIFSGHECGRSTQDDGCLVFGSFAESIVERKNGRFVSREEMRDIVQDRWEKNLVFMSANLVPSSTNAICTCCDCCCHYMESVNLYGGRVSLAAPHFLAAMDYSLCNACGKCAKVCNTHAHEVKEKRHTHDALRCIGCGLCVKTCPKKAVSMRENPDYSPPSKSWLRFGLRIMPAGLLSQLRVALSR
ncbi:MAG TPA: 4Fe-4S binding protein [Desulfomonilia bacterium]|nr:4Fe-4S binding protein [Desulfomonilia bacterium]